MSSKLEPLQDDGDWIEIKVKVNGKDDLTIPIRKENYAILLEYCKRNQLDPYEQLIGLLENVFETGLKQMEAFQKHDPEYFDKFIKKFKKKPE